MIATLQFDLDEIEDRIAHMRCVKSLDLCLALSDILANLRTECKYGEDEARVAIFEKHRADVFELLSEYGINLEELLR